MDDIFYDRSYRVSYCIFYNNLVGNYFLYCIYCMFFFLWSVFKVIVEKFLDFVFGNVGFLFIDWIFEGGIRVKWSRGDYVVEVGIIKCVVIR